LHQGFSIGTETRLWNISAKTLKYRAAISPELIENYFDNLTETLENVPPTHIVNYDETNLSNYAGRSKSIIKHRCKYSESFTQSKRYL